VRKIAEHPGQRIRTLPNEMANEVIIDRVALRQREQRLGQFPNVVVSLHVNVRFGVSGAAEIIQPNRSDERRDEEGAEREICQPLVRHKKRDRAEKKKKRPDDTDDAPRRLVMDVAVNREGADAVDGEITKAKIFELLTENAGDESEQHRPFVARNEFKPVVPRLVVAVTFAAGFEPWFVSHEYVFHAVPVKERAGIEKHDERDADESDYGKIDIVPFLFHPF